MSAAPKTRPAQGRPKYYDLSLAHLPPPGLVSIFHRISGLLLFFPLLPALLYVMDAMLGSPQGFAHWRDLLSRPLAKLVMLAFVWLYAHHFWAGIRYLLLDVHWGVEKAPARTSANLVLALGAITTVLVAWRIW